jgi:PBP1b-binding outer membrane lipoprotein LpoB
MVRAVFLLALLLAGCSEAEPSQPHAVNQMIESPLQDTVISSFDTYPPRPVDEDVTASIPPKHVTPDVHQ